MYGVGEINTCQGSVVMSYMYYHWRHGWKPSATNISHPKISKYWKLEFTITGFSKVTSSWQPRLNSAGSKSVQN